jgi:hypothetical protein
VLKMHLLFLRLVIVFDRFAPFEKHSEEYRNDKNENRKK